MLPITQVVQIAGLFASLFPNMPENIKTFVDNIIAQMPQIEAAGNDVLDYVRDHVSKVQAMISEGRDPTEEEWSALAADEQVEMDKLNSQKS